MTAALPCSPFPAPNRCRYDGSTHVQHMRKHRDLYLSDLQRFCAKVFAPAEVAGA